MSTSIESSFLARHGSSGRHIPESTSIAGKFWGLILFCASAGCVLALSLVLLTYHKNDPGFSHINSGDHVSNLLGLQGAWVADFIYLLLGWGIWVCVFGGIFFLIRGWKRLKGSPMKDSPVPMGVRVLAFVVLVLACCALFFLRFHSYGEELPGTIGGAVGSTLGTELLYWLDFNVATTVLLVVIALSTSIFLGFSWISLSESIGRFFESVAAGVKRRQEAREDEARGKAVSKERENRRVPPTNLEKVATVVPKSEVDQTMTLTETPKDISEFSPIKIREKEKKEPVVPEQTGLELDEPDEATKPTTTESSQIPAAESKSFVLPTTSLLSDPPYHTNTLSDNYFNVLSQRIETILADFHIEAKVKGILKGPVISRFRLLPKPGEKSRRFVNVASDLARRLGIPSVRVVENMREADFIGLEIPNPPESLQTINFKRVIENPVFQASTAPLTLGLGVDVSGQAVVTDLAKAPHLLVAGTTGSGKSVGINSMILSMLYKNTPEQLRLILIDPKQVEFTPYIDIPHLMTPVISDMADASRALGWACKEMERRYTLFSKAKVRNIESYNEKVNNGSLQNPMTINPDTNEPVPWKSLSYLVVIIDELADLLQTHKKEVEPAIIQLTQKARAAGIHLILATQRPSADIITPVIKSNCPTRISFKVGSRYDSMTILDQQGAEDLLGRGDMFLRAPNGELIRIHGAFITDQEIEKVTDYLKAQAEPSYVDGVTEEPEEEMPEIPTGGSGEKEQLYDQAIQIVVQENKASISYLQRRLNIGYNRAANIIERMEREGIVSKANNIGKRTVLAPRHDDI